MTQQELEAVVANQKEAADLTAALESRLTETKNLLATEEQIKEAAEKVISTGTVDAALKDQLINTLSSHKEALDFISSLAEDRAKAASVYRDAMELNPGSPVGKANQTSSQDSADEDWRARMNRIKAELVRG